MISCDGGGAAAAEVSVATTTVKMRRDGHGNVEVGGDGGGSGGGGLRQNFFRIRGWAGGIEVITELVVVLIFTWWWLLDELPKLKTNAKLSPTLINKEVLGFEEANFLTASTLKVWKSPDLCGGKV
ncbi:hypothetical protein L3X38_041734 [Prunus dulcis]|uniref:Uncharacterized protein n=1 Tax=Prunus dulcis TaxID=3755 RepID=A0AAD4YKJ3_PRUDU|nr:hypothetical protein L3X38_041734 [Prunus dulcis]